MIPRWLITNRCSTDIDKLDIPASGMRCAIDRPPNLSRTSRTATNLLMPSSVGHAMPCQERSDGDRAQTHLACRMPPFPVSPFPFSICRSRPGGSGARPLALTEQTTVLTDLGTCSAGLFRSAAPSTAPTGEAIREPPATTVCP